MHTAVSAFFLLFWIHAGSSSSAAYNAPQGPLAIQIVVNDYLIIGNKVVPNSAARINYGLGTSIFAVDILNGYYQVDSDVIGIVMPVTRVAYVYLAPGIYSFNVGVRSFQSHGNVDGATVTYELTQSPNANEKTIGTFPLVKTFAK
ncbi:unnamed protein product [Didymodactylos carnosus]|uniref:Uncharacterized protein n=1 Tax=Didymodactylos carnosus TaxID=1234261 RepID=A0A8S2DDR9_9BILA|nr:unnamed protein product [Didymodactylos carnosus]CAF3656115.1 unnamed protein product [Didymodactylos carnosus]